MHESAKYYDHMSEPTNEDVEEFDDDFDEEMDEEIDNQPNSATDYGQINTVNYLKKYS